MLNTINSNGNRSLAYLSITLTSLTTGNFGFNILAVCLTVERSFLFCTRLPLRRLSKEFGVYPFATQVRGSTGAILITGCSFVTSVSKLNTCWYDLRIAGRGEMFMLLASSMHVSCSWWKNICVELEYFSILDQNISYRLRYLFKNIIFEITF